jgi:hypothetical protein
MTREQAIEIARQCAKAKPQSYYDEPFSPHEWVIDAILSASIPRPRTSWEASTDTEKLIDALRCDASIAATADDGRLLHAAADEIERLMRSQSDAGSKSVDSANDGGSEHG